MGLFKKQKPVDVYNIAGQKIEKYIDDSYCPFADSVNKGTIIAKYTSPRNTYFLCAKGDRTIMYRGKIIKDVNDLPKDIREELTTGMAEFNHPDDFFISGAQHFYISEHPKEDILPEDVEYSSNDSIHMADLLRHFDDYETEHDPGYTYGDYTHCK